MSRGHGSVGMSKDHLRFCNVDGISEAMCFIEPDHRQIHRGNLYAISEFFDLSTGATRFISFSPSRDAHTKIAVSIGGNARMKLHEGSGPLISPAAVGQLINRNRPKQLEPEPRVAVNNIDSLSFTALSPEGLGLTLFDVFLPGGTRQFATGSSSIATDEWILSAGLQYTISILNLAAAEISGSIIIDAYAPDLNLFPRE